MAAANFDPFGARDVFQCGGEDVGIYRLSKLDPRLAGSSAAQL